MSSRDATYIFLHIKKIMRRLKDQAIDRFKGERQIPNGLNEAIDEFEKLNC